MINITKGNDFKLKATFTRGGEPYKFDSVSAVNLFASLEKKFDQKFKYEDGTLTVYCTADIPAGTFGIEVIGKEGDAQRRTAFPNVVSISNTTTAGGYDPVEDIDSYDIGMHVELDMSVDKKADSTDTKADASADEGTDTSAEGKNTEG